MRALSALLIISIISIISCTKGVVIDIGGSGTETTGMRGMLVDNNGHSVNKAKVTLFNYDSMSVSIPLALKDTSTNDSGNYTFTNVPSGIYAITGKDTVNGTVVLIGPVFYDSISDSLYELGTDTLFAPGNIKGCITFANKEDSSDEFITVYIPGTSYNAIADPENNGEFVLKNIPRGIYRVFYSTPKYLTLKSVAIVTPAETTQLECQTFYEYKPDIAPPAPVLQRPVINGISGTVNLTWNSVNISDLRRYFVFRESADSTITQIGKTSDTNFTDTLFGKNDTMPVKVWYLIKTEDTSDNVSTIYSNKRIVIANPPNYFTTHFFDWEITSFNTNSDSLYDKDSIKISVNYLNRENLNRKITWAVHNKDSVISEHILSSYSGVDSVIICNETPGTWKVYVSTTDCNDSIWIDSAHYTINKSPVIRPSNTWVSFAPISIARYNCSAVHLDSSIYVIGGATRSVDPKSLNGFSKVAINSVERLGPDCFWKTAPALPENRFYFGTAVIYGSIYVIGGLDFYKNFSTILTLNPSTDTSWTVAGELAAPCNGSACCVYDDKIYITGGINSDFKISDSIYAFDPRQKTIQGVGKFSIPRTYHQVICINDKMYLIGGYGGGSYTAATPLKSVEVYDFKTKIISKGADMYYERSNFSADTLNGKIFVVGGALSNLLDVVSSNVEEYNVNDGQWHSKSNLPYPCHSAGCVSMNNALYLIGGSINGYGNIEPISNVEVYYP